MRTRSRVIGLGAWESHVRGKCEDKARGVIAAFSSHPDEDRNVTRLDIHHTNTACECFGDRMR